MAVTSKIELLGGVPTLFVNGEPQVGMAYITYFEENNCYRDFADAGYRLFSFAAFFASQTINETSQIKPFSKGMFEEKGHPDFTGFDASVHQILDSCPEAMIFPRVNMSLPAWWEDENPDELNDCGYGEHRRRACFSSSKWRRQTEEFLLQVIDHVESMPWKDHFIGYQIASGNTEEWFSFDQKGSIGAASRAAFEARRGKLQDEIAYRQFLSEIVAEDIAYFAGVVKRRTGRRLAVGSFYGYTLETPFWQSGHMALKTILNCPDVDFLCSPASYMNTRRPGQDWPCMTVLDSLKLHGKAYFTELDTRTCLSRFPKDSREGSTVPGTYEQPIWLGPKEPDVSRWLLRVNIGRQLTHGTNSWWFDMWGGWYKSADMMREMADLRRLAEMSLLDLHRGSVAEVAVFVDETCYSHIQGKSNLPYAICYHGRLPLGLAGAPYDIYDVSDFSAVAERYRACVMLIPQETVAMSAAIVHCRHVGKPCLCVSAEHPEMTTAKLRRFYVSSGVFVWCDSDDVVYANENYLVVHAATAGAKTLRLPSRRRILPLLPSGEVFEAGVFEIELHEFETRIYRLE